MRDGVKLSIIVPTFRRADQLERLLLSLEPQIAGCSDRELIVVDDASNDPAYRRLESRFGDTMLLLTQPENTGPSAARNAGARAARGEFLVFTDDDCVAPPFWLDWLNNILAQNPDVDLIGGEARPLPHKRGMSATQFVPDDYLRLHTWSYRGVVTLCSSCIVAVRRRWYEHIGGFREPMRWAEDRNLTYRLRQAGAIMFTDHAWHVYHASDATLRQHLRRHIGYGGGLFEQAIREQPAVDRPEFPDEGRLMPVFARRAAAKMRRMPHYWSRARREKKWPPAYAILAAVTPLAMDWGYLRARRRHERRRTGLGPSGHSCLVSMGCTGAGMLGDLLAQNPGLDWEQDVFERAEQRGTEPVSFDLLVRQIARCKEQGYGFSVQPANVAALTDLSMDMFIERAASVGVTNYILLVRQNSLRQYLSVLASRQRCCTSEPTFDRWSPKPAVRIRLDISGDAGDGFLAGFDRMAAELDTLRNSLRSHRHLELSFETDIEPDPMVGLRKVAAFLDLPDYDPVIRRASSIAHPLVDIVENYNEVAALLHKTRHRWMLKD